MKLFIYFPKTSNSILTVSFAFKSTKFVNFKVCGTIEIRKLPLIIFATVKETPLIVIEPFSIQYFLNLKLRSYHH